MKEVIKFSLIVRKFNMADAKNTVIAKINRVAIRYIPFVGIDTPLNKLKTRKPPSIY